jgi:cytochrome P450
VTRPDIDLLSPAFYGDLEGMHDAFTWMRHNDPVYRCEKSGFVGVTKYADLQDVEHRDDVFSSKGSYRSVQNPEEDNMIAEDDPQHLAQRRLVSRRWGHGRRGAGSASARRRAVAAGVVVIGILGGGGGVRPPPVRGASAARSCTNP